MRDSMRIKYFSTKTPNVIDHICIYLLFLIKQSTTNAVILDLPHKPPPPRGLLFSWWPTVRSQNMGWERAQRPSVSHAFPVGCSLSRLLNIWLERANFSAPSALEPSTPLSLFTELRNLSQRRSHHVFTASGQSPTWQSGG